MGDWIRTHNGMNFYVSDPRKEEILIEDISHALSMLCRFGGHCNKFYSVAEHSCHASDLLPTEYKLYGLLHDATEAYMVDLPRPVKKMIPEYKEMEDSLFEWIKLKFKIDVKLDYNIVKDVDNKLLISESLLNMKNCWHKEENPYPDLKFGYWSPERASKEFLNRFNDLQVTEIVI